MILPLGCVQLKKKKGWGQEGTVTLPILQITQPRSGGVSDLFKSSEYPRGESGLEPQGWARESALPCLNPSPQ